jgi:DNA-binding CsgD family transcriptional regulator
MTSLQAMREHIETIAVAGYYVAIRVGFSFAEEALNTLPDNWIEFYKTHGLMMQDPAMKWVYGNTGRIRLSDIDLPDPKRVRERASLYGLTYGAAVSVMTLHDHGRRSFGMFYRGDRQFAPDELDALHQIMVQLHDGSGAGAGLTAAETEAMTMLAQGMRMKQIAETLGISESGVKARLRNAKRKLGAKTQLQAAYMVAALRPK